jgi:hypothetical protein
MSAGAPWKRIAYLINQYPKISHTFIRREMAALEAHGVEIVRFSVRPMRAHVIDPSDVAEADRTVALLAQPASTMMGAVLKRLATLRFWKTLRLALAMAMRSDRGVVTHLAYLVEACVLCDLTRTCDHRHAHFGTNAATVVRLAHHLDGMSWSFTIHGPEEFEHVASLSLPAKVTDARFTVVDCAFSRGQVLRWLPPERWRDVHIVRSMMSPAYRGSLPTPVPGTRRLVCIARLEVEKGLPVLIDALLQLPPDRRPADVIIVGDGSLRAMLEQRARDEGLTSLVRFVGWADETGLRDRILEADVVVMPSLAENLPVTVIDAFTLARPVIATWLAGIPELVQPGINGWLVPAGDEAALALAIADAMTLPATRLTEMGLAGRQRVMSLHDGQAQSAILARLFGAAGQDESRA